MLVRYLRQSRRYLTSAFVKGMISASRNRRHSLYEGWLQPAFCKSKAWPIVAWSTSMAHGVSDGAMDDAAGNGEMPARRNCLGVSPKSFLKERPK